MNALVPQSFGAMSTKFAGAALEDDISAGIQAGFGLIGYKGKVWSTRYRGVITNLMREDGDGARGSIEVVVLKAPRAVSKVYYEGGWVDGSNEQPDCFSMNGITPEPGVAKKQSNTCALCEKGKFGSRISESGTKGKACSDSKRLAVVPMQDIANESLGGPMLLRVPAASLSDFASFDEKMRGLGYVYYSYAIRIAFDPTQSYPKFTFAAIRPLTDAEADVVIAMRDSASVTRILAEGAELVAAPATEEKPSPFEQAPSSVAAVAVAAQQEVVRPTTGAASTKPAPVAAKPAAVPATQKAPSAPTPTGTAPSVPSQTGFGSPAPAKATLAPTSSSDTPADPVSSASDEDFDAALDAKMNELLPAA